MSTDREAAAPEPDPASVTNPAYERWDRDAAWPLGVAAIVFLACYSSLVLAPGMPIRWRRALVLVDYVT